MGFFYKQLQTVYRTVYKSRKYSIPKIHKPKTGRWYVYYFYEHPEEKDGYGRPKRVRFNCPSLGLNAKYKKRNEREEHFNALRDAVEILLRKGYNPFGTYQEMERKHTVEDSIDYVLDMKKVTVSKSTYSGYNNSAKDFKRFLKDINKWSASYYTASKILLLTSLRVFLISSVRFLDGFFTPQA